MDAATETALSMMVVNVSMAQPGFAGRCAKFRVAYSVAPRLSGWHPTDDARSADYKRAVAAGLADVRYERGASARDWAADYCVVVAAERIGERLTGSLACMAEV